MIRVTKLHSDEADIDEALVRRLLAHQMPRWAGLPLQLVEPIGTDNVMIRLGDALVLRLPRTEAAATGIDKEQRLLPRLAPELPVAVPTPVGAGEPGFGYPWPWSVSAWTAGDNPRPGEADAALAADLADFVNALRDIDTFRLAAKGPLHHYRADSIQLRDEVTRRCIAECPRPIDSARVARAWDGARQVADFASAPVWMHSDLHPGNILVRNGRLASVIDWGGLALGDPAVDLSVAWTLLTPQTRPAFRARVGLDDDCWRRGMAWALSVAVVALPYYIHTNAQITAWARYAIGQVVDDVLDSD